MSDWLRAVLLLVGGWVLLVLLARRFPPGLLRDRLDASSIRRDRDGSIGSSGMIKQVRQLGQVWIERGRRRRFAETLSYKAGDTSRRYQSRQALSADGAMLMVRSRRGASALAGKVGPVD
jgi:hypothetical protein